MADGRPGMPAATASDATGGAELHAAGSAVTDRTDHGGCATGGGPAVVLVLPMPGMWAETLRIRHRARSLVVSALGRSTLAGIDTRDAERLPTHYEHDIELDHRIDAAAIRAELDGADGVRLFLPLHRRELPRHQPKGVPQPVG